MSVMDAALEMSDAQALASISSGSSTKSTNIIDARAGNTDAWGTSKDPEIGGMVCNVNVNTVLVGASAAVVPLLVTKEADASISSGATTVATLPTIAALSAAGTKVAVQLPPGTTCKRYLGILYQASGGKLTSAKMDAWLGLDNEKAG